MRIFNTQYLGWMKFKLIYALFILLPYTSMLAADTLYTNPNYPPIVYANGEFKFYKYTARYIPSNLFHAFKILGAEEEETIERFKNRSIKEVVEHGIHSSSSRLRKEFCLEGYSKFVFYFHQRGIYYPRAMETYILVSFHQYLNELKINWGSTKQVALDQSRKSNRKWRQRKRKLYRGTRLKKKESRGKKRNKSTKENKDSNNPEQLFWGEFEH